MATTPPPDRVQVYKREDATTGGQAVQRRPYPTGVNRNEDMLDARGIYLQGSSTNDEAVAIWREEGTIFFQDEQVGQATLEELLSRNLGSDFDHGNRGGGSLHSVAVSNGNAGFMSGVDKARVDNLWTAHGGKTYAPSTQATPIYSQANWSITANTSATGAETSIFRALRDLTSYSLCRIMGFMRTRTAVNILYTRMRFEVGGVSHYTSLVDISVATGEYFDSGWMALPPGVVGQSTVRMWPQFLTNTGTDSFVLGDITLMVR